MNKVKRMTENIFHVGIFICSFAITTYEKCCTGGKVEEENVQNVSENYSISVKMYRRVTQK